MKMVLFGSKKILAMKKILVFAAALFAALSCTKEAPVQDNTPSDNGNLVKVTFTASVDDTKAGISDAGAFTWHTGDQIAVFDAKTGTYYPFSLEGNGGTKIGTFSASLSGNATYQFNKAYYPCSLVTLNTAGQSADVITIPGSTTYCAEAGSLIPLVGEVENESLVFSYLTATVKVTANRIPADAVKAVLSATNAISGAFNASTGAITGTGKSIALNFTKGSLSGAQTFTFPVPAGSNAVTFSLVNEANEDLFTTGSSNAKTVSFSAPSLYNNTVTVPVSVYVNYTEPWDAGNDPTPYIYLYGNAGNTGWKNTPINTGNNFTHSGKQYQKVAANVSNLNSGSETTATVIVHIGYDNDASGVPYSDLYRVVKSGVTITDDVYLTVAPVTNQTTAKIYFRNWSTNGWIKKVWAGYTDDFGGGNITAAWPGTSLSSLSSEKLNDTTTYPYITADAGKWIKFKGVNDNGTSSIKNDKYIEVKATKNTLVTLKDDDDTWTFDFGIATITVD